GRECAGGGGRDGGGNDAAAGQFGHGVLRKAAPRAHGHGGRRPSPMLLIQDARQKAVPRRIMGTSCRNAEPRACPIGSSATVLDQRPEGTVTRERGALAACSSATDSLPCADLFRACVIHTLKSRVPGP